jgi:tRNA-splicing ligase RtcB (3'-phosphate/5'-hydroxy nucleic acid ligase)
MTKLKIETKQIIALGYEQGAIASLAKQIVEKNYKHSTIAEVCIVLQNVLQHPAHYIKDDILKSIAIRLLPPQEDDLIALNENAIGFTTFGAKHIDANAKQQMHTACKLPIAVAGALMPDAHYGYGLPIGGVLATRNAVIPYGVGVDIGCRMALSIFDIPMQDFEGKKDFYKKELLANTKFGSGAQWKPAFRIEHAIMDHKDFNATPMLSFLKEKAAGQLGTSGSGNHFVDFGCIEITDEKNELHLPIGKYLSLLTHSGSRGLGAQIATHYTAIAKQKCILPKEAFHLAYLDMDSEAGQEYWLSMNLAGDFASACHDVIHRKITKAIGATVIAKVENHHNFAWKEMHNGEELIVHRKGATPAGKHVLGIIPGSMAAPGFVVSGTGNTASLHSASHGAGRVMSRTTALNSITKNELKKILDHHHITLLGGGLDEAPMVYKDINEVMNSQQELVNIVAKFTPRMVRMCDE